MTTASSRAASPSGAPDPTTVAALLSALGIVGGSWVLVLADVPLAQLNLNAHGLHRAVHFRATIGSTPGAAVAGGPTTIEWTREASAVFGLPAAFRDPAMFEGRVALLDLGATVLVEPTAEAIVLGLSRALDTSLLLAPAAEQAAPMRRLHPWAAGIGGTRASRAAR